MATLFRKLPTRRSVLFLFAMALFATALMVTPEPSGAWGVIETETFYSDGTYTTIVGRCIENSCRGTFSCTGVMTEYSKVTVRSC